MFKKFDDLTDENILLLGCGGGYDIFCGLPLYFSLKGNVRLVNFTFTKKSHLDNFTMIGNSCYKIIHNDSKYDDIYFPEYELSRELDIPIYASCDNGLINYTESLKELVEILKIDIIILCDGGCDSIMTGCEKELGTPVEDIMSMIACYNTKVK